MQANAATEGQSRPTTRANQGQRQASTANAGQRGLTRDDEDLRQDDGGLNDSFGHWYVFFIVIILLLTFICVYRFNAGQHGMTRASYTATYPPSLQTRVGGVYFNCIIVYYMYVNLCTQI
jgi:hypothetical protein